MAIAVGATILYDKGATISCRLFAPSVGSWWSNSSTTSPTWGDEASAYYTLLTEYELEDASYNRYGEQFYIPEGLYILEYVNIATSEVIGEETFYTWHVAQVKSDTSTIAGDTSTILADTTTIKDNTDTLLADTTTIKDNTDTLEASASTTITKLDIIIADVNTIIGAGGGAGETAVNHDTGGTDNLRFVNQVGAGIDNATIIVYTKEDWDAGRTTAEYSQGSTSTTVDGRWAYPIYLDAGFTYRVIFFKQNEFETVSTEITI